MALRRFRNGILGLALGILAAAGTARALEPYSGQPFASKVEKGRKIYFSVIHDTSSGSPIYVLGAAEATVVTRKYRMPGDFSYREGRLAFGGDPVARLLDPEGHMVVEDVASLALLIGKKEAALVQAGKATLSFDPVKPIVTYRHEEFSPIEGTSRTYKDLQELAASVSLLNTYGERMEDVKFVALYAYEMIGLGLVRKGQPHRILLFASRDLNSAEGDFSLVLRYVEPIDAEQDTPTPTKMKLLVGLDSPDLEWMEAE